MKQIVWDWMFLEQVKRFKKVDKKKRLAMIKESWRSKRWKKREVNNGLNRAIA